MISMKNLITIYLHLNQYSLFIRTDRIDFDSYFKLHFFPLAFTFYDTLVTIVDICCVVVHSNVAIPIGCDLRVTTPHVLSPNVHLPTASVVIATLN